MLAGIVLQLGNHFSVHNSQVTDFIPFIVIILAYAVLAIEFFVRYAYDRPLKLQQQSIESLEKPRPVMGIRLKVMAWALGFCTTCLLIRYVEEVILKFFASSYLS